MSEHEPAPPHEAELIRGGLAHDAAEIAANAVAFGVVDYAVMKLTSRPSPPPPPEPPQVVLPPGVDSD